MRDFIVIGAVLWAGILFASIILGCLIQGRLDQHDDTYP